MTDNGSVSDKKAVENPDSSVSALLGLDLPENGESNAPKDAVADSVAEEPKNNFATEASLPEKIDSANSLITLEEAKERISPDVLAALSDKFNGRLTSVRNVDPKDVLF